MYLKPDLLSQHTLITSLFATKLQSFYWAPINFYSLKNDFKKQPLLRKIIPLKNKASAIPHNFHLKIIFNSSFLFRLLMRVKVKIAWLTLKLYQTWISCGIKNETWIRAEFLTKERKKNDKQQTRDWNSLLKWSGNDEQIIRVMSNWVLRDCSSACWKIKFKFTTNSHDEPTHKMEKNIQKCKFFPDFFCFQEWS